MQNNSSIDPIELAKFNKTNQEWWDLNGEFKILHKINPIRIKYIQSMLDKYLTIENPKIIDIGSGGGLVTSEFARQKYNISGLDASEHNIKAASLYAQDNYLDINYIHNTVENFIPDHHQLFDVVLCLEVIEHVANIEKFITNVSKLVKPGGILIFSTINRTPKAYALGVIMAEYILGWVKKNTHDYKKFIKPSEIVNILQSEPIKLINLSGLTLSIRKNIWELSTDIDVNYFATFKKI